MNIAVENILAQIRQLSAADREELEHQLRLLAFDEWDKLAEVERARSAVQGLTEEDIDRACAEVRYGRKLP